MFGLEVGLLILLLFCLFCACAFEFVNGFHDTANAVATVIYTNSLQPWTAVTWSGICNFVGVLTGGIAVAMGIVNLLPTNLLIDQNVWHNVAMILALLFSAIIWNLGTWYFGLPASSSHTLIGSILGVGLAFGLMSNSVESVNWGKAGEIGLSLLISPLFGFSITIVLMYILRRTVENKAIFKEPPKKQAPPLWIRIILIITCTLVSFFHGSNDGQKGVGLVMLILISIVPLRFAIDSRLDKKELHTHAASLHVLVSSLDTTRLSKEAKEAIALVSKELGEMEQSIPTKASEDIAPEKKLEIRRDILLINKQTSIIKKEVGQEDTKAIEKDMERLNAFTNYAPPWVTVMISISLGLGTMIGWKRIVRTIGEKIGKSHLTYAQGASSELVAASTIGLATGLGLPVSTTHVLSSGIAGSMVASNGIKNLQPKTIRNIAMAWILTLPVSIFLSATLYVIFRWIL
ncbi:inorganic phosphate transporter [Cytophagaceae bacterium YF14B1]|uniref:Phosphate transporter n=1 Tax=Xanthocytophaga flava TaxID=3048013 RepID=A0AAE3QNC2_9BACT|nr:inorganic phosphate transporter [Xanthocytophaga flavus]MDJ1480590.1 inorganic phosphate transporter [Xanthocytophaga flavus]